MPDPTLKNVFEAILKYGPPRAYYVDLGSAYVAQSLKLICAELGIHLLHTQKQDCEAKGVIERWHRTLREEILDELGDRVVTLDELNAILWAWLAEEYQVRRHDTTGLVPREHFLGELDHLRRLPKGVDLDEVFLHRKTRKVRKDGTVRLNNHLYEVDLSLRGLEVRLRFDPWTLTRVEVDYRGQSFGLARRVDHHLNSQLQGAFHYEK